MKRKLLLFITGIIIATGCYSQTNPLSPSPKYGSAWYLKNFISFADAEKILKEPVYVKDSSWRQTNYNSDYLLFKFTYNTNAIDSVTRARGSLFFSLEEYQSPYLARASYNTIKTIHDKNSKFSMLSNLGDEAFLVTDGSNFPFIVATKGKRNYKFTASYRMGKNSNDELMELARKIVSEH